MNNYFYYNEDLDYSQEVPYHPSNQYLEYPFQGDYSSIDNKVYNAVRHMFFDMGLDVEHYNTKKWNPLGNYIKPGNTVLLKPNLVNHINPMESDYKKGMECMITHPSVVRVLFDYTYIALKGEGKIIIADAPIQGCNFEALLDKTGYGKLFEFIKTKETKLLKIDIEDLRETIFYTQDGELYQEGIEPRKYKGKVVDLKQNSFFKDVKNKKKLRITCYDANETIKYHQGNINQYCISRAALEADVIISIPKPKTHRIAGYTAALKNMIGVNSRKEFLPHHSFGSVATGGDEYPNSNLFLNLLNSIGNDIRNWAIKHNYRYLSNKADSFARYTGKKLDKLNKDRKKHGFWYGNDTLWRTILDVNNVVFYCGKDGKMKNKKQRTLIHIGDMIVSGEKEGPLNPTYKKVGGLLFSENPVEFDYCFVKLMGCEYSKFPVLKNALSEAEIQINNIYLNSNDEKYKGKIMNLTSNFSFILSSGWKEINKQ